MTNQVDTYLSRTMENNSKADHRGAAQGRNLSQITPSSMNGPSNGNVLATSALGEGYPKLHNSKSKTDVKNQPSISHQRNSNRQSSSAHHKPQFVDEIARFQQKNQFQKLAAHQNSFAQRNGNFMLPPKQDKQQSKLIELFRKGFRAMDEKQ